MHVRTSVIKFIGTNNRSHQVHGKAADGQLMTASTHVTATQDARTQVPSSCLGNGAGGSVSFPSGVGMSHRACGHRMALAQLQQRASQRSSGRSTLSPSHAVRCRSPSIIGTSAAGTAKNQASSLPVCSATPAPKDSANPGTFHLHHRPASLKFLPRHTFHHPCPDAPSRTPYRNRNRIPASTRFLRASRRFTHPPCLLLELLQLHR